jgi:hypothetical protein
VSEFLIKLRAMFTGSGFTDAEAGLKRVKAAADEAAKATTKATTAPSAGASPGKMFSPAESKALARSIMQDAIDKAEAAEKALRKVEDQATETKEALSTGGGSGGAGGGFLGLLARAGAAITVGLGVGRLVSSQIDAIRNSVRDVTASARDFKDAYTDAVEAISLDQVIGGFDQMGKAVEAAKDRLRSFKEDSMVAYWTDQVFYGGKHTRAQEDLVRTMDMQRYQGLATGAASQLNTASQIAGVATDPLAVEKIRRDALRAQKMGELEEALKKADSPTKISNAQAAIRDTVKAFAQEDAALQKINDSKAKSLELDLQIRKATNAGNEELQARLTWIKDYEGALSRAQASGVADPFSFAKDWANEELKKRALAEEDADRRKLLEDMEKEQRAQDASAAKMAEARKKAAKEAADAQVAEAERAARISDVDLEGRMASSRPGTQQRQLQWLRDYKSALRDLTDGISPASDAWEDASRKAGKIADNLARAASNQDKLAASASPESGDFTSGAAAKIEAQFQREMDRADKLEAQGAYSTAEWVRKKAYSRKEAQAAKALGEVQVDKFGRGPSPVDIPSISTIQNAQAEMARVAAAKLEAAAADLSAAADRLENVGRYQ